MVADQDVAVLGARGLVAQALLEKLAERGYPARRIRLLDRDEALGDALDYAEDRLEVDRAEDFDFTRVARVVVDPEFHDEATLRRARDAGCTLISLSDADLDDAPATAEPLSTATSFAMARLLPALAGLRADAARLVVLGGVSAAGPAGLEELGHQARQLLAFGTVQASVFPAQIAFNLVPDETLDRARRIADELQRLDALRQADVDVEFVWAPVFFGQAVLVQFACAAPISLQDVRSRLSACSGVALYGAGELPTPVGEASGNDDVHVGNLAVAGRDGKTLKLWLVFDNIRLMAAQVDARLQREEDAGGEG